MQNIKKEKILRILLYTFLTIIFIIPFLNTASNVILKFQITFIFAAIMIVMLAFYKFWKLTPFRKIINYFIAFILLNILFIPFSINISNSIRTIFFFSSYLMVFCISIFFTINFKEDKTIRKIIKNALYLLLFIVALKAITQFFFEFDYMLKNINELSIPADKLNDYKLRLMDKRVFSFFLYSNIFGGFLNLLIPLVFGVIIIRSKNKKNKVETIISILIIITSVIAMLLTRSIGVILSISLTIIIIFFLIKKGLNIKTIKYAYISIFTMLLLILVLLFTRRNDLTDVLSYTNPVIMRYYNWVAGLNIFFTYPLTGIGLGNFGDIYPRFMIKGHTQYVHNTYIQILLESGIMPFIFLGLSSWEFIKAAYRSINKVNPLYDFSLYLFAAIFTFILHNTVDFSFYTYSTGITFSVLAGILLGINHEKHIYH
ncbi:hypothetical protein KAU33_06175 [Candidatus Dependentiae bacterium]|nr:hypothetical protein [Candidatus Dependentiae bacterium]